MNGEGADVADHDEDDRDPHPTRSGAKAMGDQEIDDIRSSLPPGAGTKPADARGDVDRLQPYDDGGPLRMADVEVPPDAVNSAPEADEDPDDG